MRCIIAGTRTIKDYRVVRQAIKESGWGEQITEVVSGAHEGHVDKARFDNAYLNVDVLGAQLAMLEGIPVKYFPADWGKHGKSAGPIRNEQMARYAHALILVWDGVSRGSKDMLERAIAHGLRYFVYEVGKQGHSND